MKLLCFSDIHNSEKAIAHIVERSQSVDLVIGAGDFCNIHSGLETTIEKLSAIQAPGFFVPGNSETYEEMQRCCDRYPNLCVLHGTSKDFMGVTFFGIGGGIPVTPFGSWSWDFTEKQAAQLLADCPEQSVLISHSPPKDCLDLTSTGKRVGSATVREVMLRKGIQLTVCGHIHESSGQLDFCQGIPVINAGPGCVEYQLPAA